ncbi:hypothetical protein Sa4125_39020 [Aureimonas sp. SA4125]|nr:hypothetical protein Sa4125_39020 [Aureimonas sp. SA4125]
MDFSDSGRSGAKRFVVVALRERMGRTLTFIRNAEQEGVAIAKSKVASTAAMFADEASHWDALEAFFPTTSINHSESYSDGHGKHTNWVESYFSRLRRMVRGQHHSVSAKLLHLRCACRMV